MKKKSQQLARSTFQILETNRIPDGYGITFQSPITHHLTQLTVQHQRLTNPITLCGIAAAAFPPNKIRRIRNTHQ